MTRGQGSRVRDMTPKPTARAERESAQMSVPSPAVKEPRSDRQGEVCRFLSSEQAQRNQKSQAWHERQMALTQMRREMILNHVPGAGEMSEDELDGMPELVDIGFSDQEN